jgi:putative ABC transport system substrate-binding protein
MRRRDLTIGVLLAAVTQSVLAQQPATQHRIAIVIPSGPVARASDGGGSRFYRAIFDQMRQLGDVEGQNLTVDRYSGGGRPEAFADLARDVVDRNPQVVVASSNPIALAVRAVTSTIPIVWIGGDPIRDGLATGLAYPNTNSSSI